MLWSFDADVSNITESSAVNVYSMTTENIEISDLKSWEHAFSFPVQSVRKAELQLRRQINDRNERLRSKVGYIITIGACQS